MTTDQPGPLLRAAMEAAGVLTPVSEPLPPVTLEDFDAAVEHETAMIGADIITDVNRQVMGGSHLEHLVMHEKAYARLRAAAGLERKQHEERVPISRFSFWWQRVLLGIFRWAADELARHLLAEGHDNWTFTEARDDAGIHSDRIVTVFDETEEEYIARLKKRAIEGPQSIGIPIYSSPNVPRGTAYAVDSRVFNDPDFLKVGESTSIIVKPEPRPPIPHPMYAGLGLRPPGSASPSPYDEALLKPTSVHSLRVDPDEET